eukprot:5004422-Prymnesium_polylepis.1
MRVPGRRHAPDRQSAAERGSWRAAASTASSVGGLSFLPRVLAAAAAARGTEAMADGRCCRQRRYR